MTRRFWLRALPCAGTAGVLFLVFRRVPPERLLAAFGEADPVRFLVGLVPVSIAYVALDSGLMAQVTRRFHPPGLDWRDALRMRAVDYLVTLWNGRASQAAIAAWLGRRLRIAPEPDGSWLEAAGTILFLDVCQRSHLLLWGLVGSLALWGAAPRQVPVAAAISLAGVGLLIAFLRGRLRRVRLGPPRWRLLRTLRSARLADYGRALLWKAPLILIAATGHQIALEAFSVSIPWTGLLATLPIIFLAGALPITVARIGTAQAAWLYFHGEAAAASAGGEAGLLGYSLAAHLTFLLLNAAITAPALPGAWSSLRLGAVDGASGRSVSSSTGSVSP